MALYLGSGDKLKINLNGVAYYLNSHSVEFTISGILLLSSDGYTLKDSNGLYLTAKESG